MRKQELLSTIIALGIMGLITAIGVIYGMELDQINY